MIQRKQTVYLFLATVVAILCGVLLTESLLMMLIALAAALLQLATIFLYKNRKLQAQLCVVAMFLLVGWYIGLGVLQHASQGTLLIAWPVALPAVSIFLTFLARKGIMADEKLVRSLDRIR